MDWRIFNHETSRNTTWPSTGELKSKMADIGLNILQYLNTFPIFKFFLSIYFHQFRDIQESLTFNMQTIYCRSTNEDLSAITCQGEKT